MWQLPLIIITVMIAGLGGLILYQSVRAYLPSSWVDARLALESMTVNRKLPKMVDRISRLDFTSIPGTHQFAYHYTILDDPTFDKQIFGARIRAKILKAYRESNGMAYFRNNGVSLIYEYSDSAGHQITVVKVEPADLQ